MHLVYRKQRLIYKIFIHDIYTRHNVHSIICMFYIHIWIIRWILVRRHLNRSDCCFCSFFYIILILSTHMICCWIHVMYVRTRVCVCLAQLHTRTHVSEKGFLCVHMCMINDGGSWLDYSCHHGSCCSYLIAVGWAVLVTTRCNIIYIVYYLIRRVCRCRIWKNKTTLRQQYFFFKLFLM